MRIQVAEVTPYGAPVLVAVVPSYYTNPSNGPDMLRRLQPYYRQHPIMLVSVEQNGFRAYATFETHMLLALIQLEFLELTDLDLSVPAPEQDEELPF